MTLREQLSILDKDTIVRIENDIYKRFINGFDTIERYIEGKTITNGDTVLDCLYSDYKLSDNDLNKIVRRIFVDIEDDRPIVIICIKDYIKD